VFGGTLLASQAVGNGIAGYRPIVHDLTITGFLFGLVSLDRLQLDDATITDSVAVGVAGKKLTIVGTTITNNGFYGIDGWTDRGHGVRLIDSTVTGNGTDPLCGTQPCADVAGVRQPRVVNSACSTSLNISKGGTWGVCTLD
jgi:hypothetical protein